MAGITISFELKDSKYIEPYRDTAKLWEGEGLPIYEILEGIEQDQPMAIQELLDRGIIFRG